MSKETKYKLVTNANDEHNSGYAGDAYNLVSEINKVITKLFVTESVMKKILDKVKGKPIPRFHLRFVYDEIEEGRFPLDVEFTDNLTSLSPITDDELKNTIKEVVQSHVACLGYISQNFIETLVSENKNVKKFFKQ